MESKKSTYKKWVEFTKENKREKLEKATAELISIGLPKEQSKAIADVKVNHPEVYESLEDIIEHRVKQENKMIINLTKALEGYRVKR